MGFPIPTRTFVALAAILAAATSVPFASSKSDQSATSTRHPVLVELFTSEGCSDCPPADALLARLDSAQFVPAAQAIVLSEHVTYWNHLGWRDPFSSPAMDERQRQYAQHFSLDEVYTPQVVVDGMHQLVGSDTVALTQAVAQSASISKQQIVIENPHWASGEVSFAVRAPFTANARLFTALAEDATRSQVARGENAGRTLHHVAVVRILKEFDVKLADGKPLQLAYPALSGHESSAGPLRLVVFLADRNTGHILAIAEQTISR